ncbi:hypothetical protein LCGC14_2065170, partial [marine sediment metagenome]
MEPSKNAKFNINEKILGGHF